MNRCIQTCIQLIKFIAFIGMFFTFSTSSATHIVGGDLTYTFIGNNQYRIQLFLYIDCVNGLPAAIDQDRNGEIGIFSGIGGSLLQSLNTVRSGPQRIEARNYTCVRPPANACVDLYIYETTATLAPRNGGYQIVFQRCCRNNTINNIIDPESTGATYRTFIPDPGLATNNNSAKFVGLPPNFLCTNEELVFDHSATDLDGDSLVYSLCNPLRGGTTNNPLPIPANPPPYQNITWSAPYNVTNQMGGLPPINLDPQTGRFTVTPTVVGQFVVGVCVSEFRNGQLINTVLRDFQFNVLACRFSVQARFSTAMEECKNTVSFNNTSTGNITRYKWDFGVTSRTDDTSNAQQPNFEYPGPGFYTVRLETYNENNCSTVAFRDIHILPPLKDRMIPDSLVCFGDEIIIGVPNPDANTAWSWSPGTNLSATNIPNPSVKVTQDITYRVRQTSVSCFLEDSVKVTYDKIKAEWEHEYLPPCDGLKVSFTSRSSGNTSQLWAFGDPGSPLATDTKLQTEWFYKDTGIVFVKLLVKNERCADSLIKPINIIHPGVFSIKKDTSLCLGNSYFIGPANDTSIISFQWLPTDFLDNAGNLYTFSRPRGSIVYVLKKDYATCTRYDTFSVVVNELPDFKIIASRNDELCPGDSIFLESSGNFSFEWFPKDGVRQPFSANTWVQPSQTTTYILRAITSDNCLDEDSIEVAVAPIWELDLSPSYTICEGFKFLPDINIDNADFKWFKLNSEVLLDSLTDEDKYRVVVTTKCQVLIDTFELRHYKPFYCEIDFPNAFTPNKDRWNETFPFAGRFDEIFGAECVFENYRMIIFNRWGEIIFETTDPKQEWDGEYAKHPTKNEVYVYYVQYTEFNFCTGFKDLKIRKGNFTLLR